MNAQLLDHSLVFTAKHRGEVRRGEGVIEVLSDEEDFRCLILDGAPPRAAIPPARRVVRTLPWHPDVSAELQALGFERKGVLRYLTLQRPVPPPDVPSAFRIQRATEPAALRGFSEVQTRGFLLPNEPFGTWYAFLHAANSRNLPDAAQHFYLGTLGNRPAAATLALVHEGIAGLYAVTTLVEFRRRGFSQALLHCAVERAYAAGCQTVTLQVYGGTPAERMYEKLGFVKAFDSEVWVRS